ncbi:MAG: hypothetical protein P8L79_13680 [Rhodospirillaceae bacterium]|nr:hypothetical protein [Rhodospirillaceae bacterium]
MTKPRRHPRPRPRTARKRPKKAVSRRRGPIVRVLPLMIVVAVCALGFRVTIVAQDMRTIMASVDVGQSSAIAQEETSARIDEFEDAALNGGDAEDQSDGDVAH